MDTTSDHELLRAWNEAQDEHAFAQIVERHAALVHATCRRVCRDGADADDAAQEAFVALARQGRRVTGPLIAWLHVVATRRAWRAVRRRRLPLAVDRWTGEAVVARDRSQEVHDERGDLDHAIAGLPSEHRATVVLTYLAGCTQDEVASRLGVSQPTVHRRLAEALTRLRERLTLGLAAAAVDAVPPPHATIARWARIACARGSALGHVACAAAGLALCASVCIAWPPPHRAGLRYVETLHQGNRLMGGLVLLGVAVAVVELAAHRRLRRSSCWPAIALSVAALLQFFTITYWVASDHYMPAIHDSLVPGGGGWLAALAMSALALIAYGDEIRRAAAKSSPPLSALRAALGVAVLLVVALALAAPAQLRSLPPIGDDSRAQERAESLRTASVSRP